MTNTAVVLKKEQVRPGGTRRLGVVGGAVGAAGGATTARASVRILQQNGDGAVLEITCPCGRKTLVQCQYAAPPDGEARPIQPGPSQGEQ